MLAVAVLAMVMILRPVVGNADEGTGRMAGRVSAKRGTANTGGREPKGAGRLLIPPGTACHSGSSSFQQQGEGCHGDATVHFRSIDAPA
ncbi:MAG: hypothetical protein CVT75_11120 [Alphaproteobacteria bacterium HGW-Alphaproteobacteria-14]|nr:MAG: hypothetical protein CVT75_11120 [Alphaproteobacteria bacterium HGW-Alphaproteobacteria-14]